MVLRPDCYILLAPQAPIKMKLDGLLDMAGKAASKVLDKDGDGKVTMSDISQGMKDAAEQNLIPANMKPLYDSLNVSD